ncbi:Os01g0666101, partial [Oryza sativa Japonica Group]
LERHLCAWGNDAASEVIPRRVNCWLKTISKPPLWPVRATENFWKGSFSSGRVKPNKS